MPDVGIAKGGPLTPVVRAGAPRIAIRILLPYQTHLKVFFTMRTCLGPGVLRTLAIVFAMTPIVARGQAPQPVNLESRPPDFSALPPPDYTNAELAKRLADVEKILAEQAKAGAPKSSAPAKPLIAPSGRIQFDMANFTQNPISMAEYGNAPNSIGFRRARLALLGEFEVIDYIIEMDFANRGVGAEVNSKDQSTGFKDVYIQVRDLPNIGNVRIGHFKEGFGLEQMTSDNYTTFMERSVIDEGTFVPGRNNGIQAFNWTEDQRMTWSIGAFANQTGFDQPPLFQYDHWESPEPCAAPISPGTTKAATAEDCSTRASTIRIAAHRATRESLPPGPNPASLRPSSI